LIKQGDLLDKLRIFLNDTGMACFQTFELLVKFQFAKYRCCLQSGYVLPQN
jgi:hypothetical protein